MIGNLGGLGGKLWYLVGGLGFVHSLISKRRKVEKKRRVVKLQGRWISIGLSLCVSDETIELRIACIYRAKKRMMLDIAMSKISCVSILTEVIEICVCGLFFFVDILI